MRHLTAIAALALLLPGPPAAAAPSIFTVDGVHSRVEFGVRHLVISTVKGEFPGFEGTILLDGEDPAAWKIEGRIDAASISTGDEKRDAHLKSPDFLDVAKYPEITFRSTKIRREGEGYVATAQFTLHGITRVVEIPFTLAGPIADPWGNRRIGLTASWNLDRRDYGIVWSQALETGGLMVGNNVSIDLNIEAAHAPER